MKLLMLCQEDLAPIKKAGIKRKIFGQARAFQTHGFEVAILYVYRKQLTFKASLEAPDIILCPARNLFEISYRFFQQAIGVVKRFQPHALYVRSTFAEPNYLSFLKKARALKVACFCEFATYPYDQEYQKKPLYKRLLLHVDIHYRQQLHKYIQHAFTYTNYTSVLNIPAIRIENGLEVKSIPLRSFKHRHPQDPLILLGVANLSFWQGYDRVIEGLKLYYAFSPRDTVHFHIVGDGPALNELKALCEKYNLQDCITFWGMQDGAKLQRIYQQADIGISTLAFHRKGLEEGASLKSREYCAVGLPFVYAFQDNDFAEKFEYTLKLPADDTSVDIHELIQFHQRLADRNYLDEMRQYAENSLDWSVKLKPVAQKIRSIYPLSN